MRKRVHIFHRLLSRYNRYRRKLDRINSGTSRYDRKDLLIKRVQSLYAQLMRMKEMYRIATVKMALSAGLAISVTGAITGQNLVLKTDNALQLAHIENDAKPVLVDFDGDNDLDLFVGGKVSVQLDSTSAGIYYYRNDDGKLNQVSSPFPADLGTGTDLVDTARVSLGFIDLDSDGDMDAFAGLSNGTIKYYRNDEGAMVNVVGSDNPFNGVRVGDSNNASPAMADVDGDGDLDAVIGKYDGGIAYYKNEDGVFVNQTNGATDPNPFADINVTESAAPAMIDFDADGDLDLFVGNKAGEIAYFRNDEGAFVAVEAMDNPFSGFIFEDNAGPTLGDVDSDGDIDLIVGINTGMLFYLRNDEGTFVNVLRNTLGIDDLGDNINHAVVDFDGDGDQDMLTGEFNGRLIILENNDGLFSQAAVNPLDTPLVQVDYISSPAVADIDMDGDMDVFVGSYQAGIKYFQNDSGVYSEVTGEAHPFNGIEAGDNENIAFVDLDGDGDMDAFIGNKAGEVKYFVNNEGVFSELSSENPFEGVSFQAPDFPNHSVKPAFMDMDGDEDMDAFFGIIDGTIRVFENQGEAMTIRSGAPDFVELTGEDNPFNGMDFGRSAAPRFGDLDGDGDMDMVVSNAAGLTFHLENQGSSSSAKEIFFSADTKVFPNPTTGKIQVEIPWAKESVRIQIFTVSGQLIDQIKAQYNRTEIDMSTLPDGMYMLKVISPQGQAVKRVMKQ